MSAVLSSSVGWKAAAIPSVPIWRLSVAQYHEMIRTGILTADDQVELLEGWLVYKMPKNPPHRIVTKLTRNAFEAIVPAGYYVDSQEPITLTDGEPEPDVAIIRGATRDYQNRHPGAAEVVLTVEVADTTLECDQGVKKRSYARAGIPVYWIINVKEDKCEVYTEPTIDELEADYQQRRDCTVSDEIPVMIEGQLVGSISLRDLLP